MPSLSLYKLVIVTAEIKFYNKTTIPVGFYFSSSPVGHYWWSNTGLISTKDHIFTCELKFKKKATVASLITYCFPINENNFMTLEELHTTVKFLYKMSLICSDNSHL